MTPRRRILASGALGCGGTRTRVTANVHITQDWGENATALRCSPTCVYILTPMVSGLSCGSVDGRKQTGGEFAAMGIG
jgi:hypothetical protein